MAIHLIADDIIRTAGATALEFCTNAGIDLKEIALENLRPYGPRICNGPSAPR